MPSRVGVACGGRLPRAGGPRQVGLDWPLTPKQPPRPFRSGEGHPKERTIPEELIPIIFFQAAAVVGLAFSPIGRAIARRIGGGKLDGESAADLDELRSEVADLRRMVEDIETRTGGQVDEISNRLDFAERLLAKVKDRQALPGSQ